MDLQLLVDVPQMKADRVDGDAGGLRERGDWDNGAAERENRGNDQRQRRVFIETDLGCVTGQASFAPRLWSKCAIFAIWRQVRGSLLGEHSAQARLGRGSDSNKPMGADHCRAVECVRTLPRTFPCETDDHQ